MRSYAISTMFLAFVLLTGACAGRQARTRSIPATALASTPAVETPVADMAPVIAPASVEEPAPAPEPTPVVADEPELTTQQKIDRYVAAEIAAHNAAVRAAAEKLHRTPMPPAIENNDEIVAALKFDADRARSIDERASEDFAAMMRILDERVSKPEAAERASRPKRVAMRPRPKPKAAPAVEEGGREAAVGSLAFAAPAVTAPAAPAAPSVILAPQGKNDALGADVRAAAAPPLYVSDRESVATARDQLQIYAIGALMAALMGAVGALVLIFFRNRSLAAIAADAYEDLPDGAVVVQEISGGRVVATNVILPGLPSSRSEPEMSKEEKQKMMDDQEETFLAAGDAMQEEAPSPEPPVHDRFDYSDTPIEGPEPSIPVPEASSEPKPPDDETPRFASGSGQLIASTPDAPTASGVIHAPDPPTQEPRSEPEVPTPRIIYEDDSSSVPALTAGPAASN